MDQVSVWRSQEEMRPAPLAMVPSLEALWAVLCGGLATGRLGWESAAWFRLLAAWLVADAALGCVWAQLRALKHLAPHAPSASAEARAGLVIPYAAPGSPAGRLVAQMNRYLTHWHAEVWPGVGRIGVTALVAAGLALTLATYLGPRVLAATGGGLLLGAGCALAAGDEVRLTRWLAGLHVLLAWMLGHGALAPWRGATLGLALLVGLEAYGRALGNVRRGSWISRAVRMLLVVVFLVARQPLIAALLATGTLAEQMANPRAARSTPNGRRLAWLLVLLLAALAVGHWA